jgi:hypothetical protein
VLEVTGEAAAAAEPVPGGAAARPRPQGDLFLWTRLDKSKAYVGEQLVYTLEVYERLPFPNIQLRALPGFQDFWSEELPEGDQRTETVAGVPYRVHPGLRRGPVPAARRHADDHRGRGDASACAAAWRATDADRGAAAAERGSPADFSVNNVGNYTIEATVDRAKVKQGEPFTLTVTISGTGNIRVIDPGAVAGARRHAPLRPQGRDAPAVGMRSAASGIYEFFDYSRAAGDLVIPPHSFAFFDPATSRYQTVQTKPIALAVAADANAPAPSKQADKDPVAARATRARGACSRRSSPRDAAARRVGDGVADARGGSSPA